ncbi:TonB-dependent receptor [Hyphococcus luteus]|uniref:TonB-dependent receptor n=1 Tax=Hyphococcus luteus TaxID=2058213 RepID=A0A2S7K2N1_9PROT|nr:TonB-dependent receptor [Marinicaulis flavus]PQA86760.1 TonB-dependent receptor [Marinicaulis flavus]
MHKKLLLSGAAALAMSAPAYAQDEDHGHEDDEIIVTASPIGHPEHESIIPASVLTEEELASRGEASIGQLLRQEPGVSATFFGPAASRPVIRGLSGDRVSVLDAGIGSIDASSVSDDHAVAVDPAMAKRIEIVRGAATLYYGSSAAGGVVNVFDGRIPDAEPEGGLDGALRTSLATVDDSVEAAGGFDALVAKAGDTSIVFHGEGYYRNTDDYDIPGFAESEAFHAAAEAEEGDHEGEEHAEEEEAFGTAPNTAMQAKGGAVGGSVIFPDGYIGVSAKFARSLYGVPGHQHHEAEGVMEAGGHGEEAVNIDLEQNRYDLMGEFNKPFLFVDTTKIRFGYADYTHQELEGDAVGTTFNNKGFEGRVEFLEKQYGNFRGASGFQVKHRNFEAIGDEAFTPPNITDQFGVFTMREYETDNWHVQVGGRYEHTKTEADTVSLSRSFDAFSVSAGLGVEPADNLFFGVNALRTERAPAPEELFSNGPHLATNAYEVGDPTLGIETARGVETTLHGEFGRLSATVNGFYTDYKDFVALTPTGAEEEEIPVFTFGAHNAVFKGFEAQADADLFSLADFDVSARAQLDYVKAKFKNDGGAVPRIPPLRSIFGLEATSPYVDLRGEVEIAADQKHIADYELPTDGYTLVNLAATFRPGGEDSGLSVQLRADNVTNEEARLATSFLKDVAPLPGRSFKVTLRGEF